MYRDQLAAVGCVTAIIRKDVGTGNQLRAGVAIAQITTPSHRYGSAVVGATHQIGIHRRNIRIALYRDIARAGIDHGWSRINHRNALRGHRAVIAVVGYAPDVL